MAKDFFKHTGGQIILPFFVWDLKVRFNLFGITKTAAIIFLVLFFKCHQKGNCVHHIDVFVISPQKDSLEVD